MATYFAEIVNGKVERVIVADRAFIDSGQVGDPKKWVETFPEAKEGGTRKNYASPGYEYDSVKDVFIQPKPFDSWVLNEEKAVYESPVPVPKDGKEYKWDEKKQTWADIKLEATVISEEIIP